MNLTGIGDRLKTVRGQMTIEQFAAQIGVHKSTIMRWEREENYPDAKALALLKSEHGVEIDWLVTGQKNSAMDWDLYNNVVSIVKKIMDGELITLPVEKLNRISQVIYDDIMEKKIPFDEIEGKTHQLLKIAR